MESEADNTLDILLHAVDVGVIRERSQVPSQTTRTRENFRQQLAQRDGEQCVWTGFSPGVAMHIIPFRRGDEACLFPAFLHHTLTICTVASIHHWKQATLWRKKPYGFEEHKRYQKWLYCSP
jgi:hypothetical protein